MIKAYLRPFFKRFIGLFLSMTFVSLLAISLLIAFGSAVTNLVSEYNSFKTTYGSPDILITTEFTSTEKIAGLSDIEGIDIYDTRFSHDVFLKKNDGRIITSRVFSYNTEKDKIQKLSVVDSTADSDEYVDISVTSKFAEKNGFKVGDTLEIGFMDFYETVHISSIVQTAESIYTRASNYIFSDNSDFGYMYITESELSIILDKFYTKLVDKIKADEDGNGIYEKIKSIEVEGFDIDEFIEEYRPSKQNYAHNIFTQIIIRLKKGVELNEVSKEINSFLINSDIQIKSTTKEVESVYDVYMTNSIKQIRVAAIFLPVFFYIVTMVIIILFLNQIIKSMTAEIGTMMGVGISAGEITGLFSIYTLIMSLVSSAIGIGVGYGLSELMNNIFRDVYSMFNMQNHLSPLVVSISIIGLILISQIAVLIASKSIQKITPKDAMSQNESKRKDVPPFIQKITRKSSMNVKLGVNFIVQNPRRFFVSVFAIFASFVLIVLTTFFNVSKDELLNQTFVKRMNFDCQLYAADVIEDPEFEQNVKEQEFVKDFVSCYFTYLEVKSKDKYYMIETLAFDPENKTLMYIPNENDSKRIFVEEKGIILPHGYADKLGVKIGDYVTINGVPVKVANISRQYQHMTMYMSKEQLIEVKAKYSTSYLANITDQNTFLQYLTDQGKQFLTVFSNNLYKDMSAIFKSINVFIIILVGFSFLMGFIILTIMSQNALMEQKRKLSIMRAVGFTIKDISNIWTMQSGLQLFLSTLFAVPLGCVFSIALFKIASSATQIYPFIFSIEMVAVAFAFIFVVILLAHIISMITINRWNLAENTRSRE